MWLIDELNRLAVELLENAEALEQHLENAKDLTKGFEQVQKWLDHFCQTLGRILTLLAHPESPLPALMQYTDGGEVSDKLAKVQTFLDDHRSILARLGVNPSATDKVIEALQEQVKAGGDSDLTTPQTLDPSVLKTLTDFRDLVCEIAHSQLLKGAAEAREILLGVVSGVIGTATVVIDVTTAAAALPHGIGVWACVKLVKSVWSGVNRVRKAINTVREKWNAIKNRKVVSDDVEKLRKLPKVKLRKGPK